MSEEQKDQKQEQQSGDQPASEIHIVFVAKGAADGDFWYPVEEGES